MFNRFFFSLVSSSLNSALSGLQYYNITSKVNLIINSSINIFFVILLLLGFGLCEGIYLNMGASLISFIIYIYIVKKKMPFWKFSPKIKLKFLKTLFNYSIYVFLTKISDLFSNYIVRFIISFFLGPIALTHYVVPSKIIGALGGVFSNALNVVFPFVSQLDVEKNEKDIKKTVLIGSKIFLAIGFPIITFIFLFSKPILELWMGNNFAKSSWFVLGILAISSLLGSFSTIPNLVLLGKGNSKLVGIMGLIAVFLYSIFLPIFTKLWGINGTALGMLFTSIISVTVAIKMSSRHLNFEIYDYLRIVIYPHLGFILFSVSGFISGIFRLNYNPYLYISLGLIIFIFYFIYLIRSKLIPIKELYKVIK